MRGIVGSIQERVVGIGTLGCCKHAVQNANGAGGGLPSRRAKVLGAQLPHRKSRCAVHVPVQEKRSRRRRTGKSRGRSKMTSRRRRGKVKGRGRRVTMAKFSGGTIFGCAGPAWQCTAAMPRLLQTQREPMQSPLFLGEKAVGVAAFSVGPGPTGRLQGRANLTPRPCPS